MNYCLFVVVDRLNNGPAVLRILLSLAINRYYWAHRSFYQQRLVLSLDVQEIL